MKTLRMATLGIAWMIGVVSIAQAAGAPRVPPTGVGFDQHALVMSNIYQAQQQNDRALAHVRDNIAASPRRPY